MIATFPADGNVDAYNAALPPLPEKAVVMNSIPKEKILSKEKRVQKKKSRNQKKATRNFADTNIKSKSMKRDSDEEYSDILEADLDVPLGTEGKDVIADSSDPEDGPSQSAPAHKCCHAGTGTPVEKGFSAMTKDLNEKGNERTIPRPDLKGNSAMVPNAGTCELLAIAILLLTMTIF